MHRLSGTSPSGISRSPIPPRPPTRPSRSVRQSRTAPRSSLGPARRPRGPPVPRGHRGPPRRIRQPGAGSAEVSVVIELLEAKNVDIAEHKCTDAEFIVTDDPLRKAFSYLSASDLFLVGCVDKRFLRVSRSLKLWEILQGYALDRTWCNRNGYAKVVYSKHQAKLRVLANQRQRSRMECISTCVPLSSYVCFSFGVLAFPCFFILLAEYSLIVAMVPLSFSFLCCIPQVLVTYADIQTKDTYLPAGPHFANLVVFLAGIFIVCNFLVFLVGFRLDNIINWNWVVVLVPLFLFSGLWMCASFCTCAHCSVEYLAFGDRSDFIVRFSYFTCLPIGCCSAIIFPVVLVLHLNLIVTVPPVVMAMLCFTFLVPGMWCILLVFLESIGQITFADDDD